MRLPIIEFFLRLLISSCLFVSCNSSTSVKTKEYLKKDSILRLRITADQSLEDTTGFFNNCKFLMNTSYAGALQVPGDINDSSKYLYFAACYNSSRTYEIIFVYKGGIEKRKLLGYDSLGKIIEGGCDNNFSAFDCYAFVLPMRDPEKQADIHAINISFPVIVEVYKRIKADDWLHLRTMKIKTFDEYVTLQFKTIYSE